MHPSTLIDTLPGIVWTAWSDGEIDYLNQNWYAFTGQSRRDSQHSGWQSAVYPEDLPQLLESWQFACHSTEPREIRLRLRRFEGRYRWFLARIYALAAVPGTHVRWCALCSETHDLMDLAPRHVHRARPDLYQYRGARS